MKRSIKNIVILSVIVVAVGLVIWWIMNFLSTEEGWVTRYANSARTGALQTEPLSKVKGIKKDFGPEGTMKGEPIVVGDEIFVGYNLRDQRKFPLIALNDAKGEIIWTFTPTESGSSMFHSPTVYEGIVYALHGNGYLYALDRQTGSKVWKVEINPSLLNSPAAMANKIFVAGTEGDMGKIYALEAKTGEKIWTYKTKLRRIFSPTAANNKVYITEMASRGDSGAIYALNAETGEQMWTQRAKTTYVSSAAAKNEKVFIVDAQKVYGLRSRDGKKLWSFKMAKHMPIWTSPTIKNGKVFVGDITKTIYALDVKTGEKIWDYTAESKYWTKDSTDEPPEVTSVTAAGDKIYFEVEDLLPVQQREKAPLKTRKMDAYRITYCLNAKTGKKIWQRGYKFNRDYAHKSAPVVVDGKMYGVDEDFNLKVLSGD